MAVIKYSGLVDQLRGKLGGTVLSKFKGGYNAYVKGQPKRQGSAQQQRRRQQVSEHAGLWSNLLPEQRSLFTQIAANTPWTNRLGDTVYLSGFQFFMYYSLHSSYAGYQPSFYPATTYAPAYAATYEFTALNTTTSPTGSIIAALIGAVSFTVTSDSENMFFLYISNPEATPEANFNNTDYLAYTELVPDGLPTGGGNPFSVANLQMPNSFRTWNGAYHQITTFFINTVTAQKSLLGTYVVQSTYTPPDPPVWPITFTYPPVGTNAATPMMYGGSQLVFNTAFFTSFTSEVLGDDETLYTIQFEIAGTTYADPTTGASYFTGSEYTVTQDPYWVRGVSTTTVDPLSSAQMSIYSLDHLALSAADAGRYIPVRFRIAKKSDMLYSSWQYNMIYIHPLP